MKTLLASVCLTLTLLVTANPAHADHRRRYDDEDYRREKKRIEDSWTSVKEDYHHVLEMRDRFGSDPVIRRQLARADYLFNHIHDELKDRDISFDHVRSELSELRDQLARIHEEYHDYANRPRYRVITPSSRHWFY